MYIHFPETGFLSEDQGEIDEVLRRIAVGDRPGCWQTLPDEITILGRLAGGRSGSEVLEVLVKQGYREARKVIKLGPLHDLAHEFLAYRTFLYDASVFFVRIEAATPGVLEGSRERSEEREAVVYDHAARFQGRLHGRTGTFEELASEGIRCGGATLDKTIGMLQTFFEGIRNDLYERYQVNDHESALHRSWNHRLGIDATIAVDSADTRGHMLKTTVATPYGITRRTLWPRDIAQASIRVNGSDTPGHVVVHLPEARMYWQSGHLFAKIEANHLHVEIVADGDRSLSQLASAVEDASIWTIQGRLDSIRALTHQERLLRGLGDAFQLSDQMLIGPGAQVPNPFDSFAPVLEKRRRHRITSVVHGDLNPRNILIIEDVPCVIDYAMTSDDQPIMLDFTRLEGCLARDVLPDDLSWAEHVRLQRLLAAACRLGDEAARRFLERLADESAVLASAFRLLWTIRNAARAAYPQAHQEQWARDYLEELFLFAHLTLKWDNPEARIPAKLRATAAMMGVAAEALSEKDSYCLWNKEALRADGGEILHLLQKRPEHALHELANLWLGLCRTELHEDDEVRHLFEQVRATLVKEHFREAALAAIMRLDSEHEVYISLKAYIDLKGQLRKSRKRERHSTEEMLAREDLLAEKEHLQDQEGSDEDVLRLIAIHPAAVLIGDAGSGKSTVAREWEYQLANAIVQQEQPGANHESEISPQGRSGFVPRLPLVLRAPDLVERLHNWNAQEARSTASVLGPEAANVDDLMDVLTIGACYVIIDALNEVTEEQKQRVADWLISLRNTFPSTPFLVCHRQYNYVPGLLPFPIITLQKVEIAQARTYIHEYLRERQVPDHEHLAQQLVRLLLEDPEYEQIRDLAQTPLFLWMLVEHYRETREVPRSRGELFDTFSRWYLEQRYHDRHRERAATRYPYEDKAQLLGILGYELVQRRETRLAEQDIPRLVQRAMGHQWRGPLEEIIEAEMLIRDGTHLRFLHQSFQEYFAARHFLMSEATSPEAIRQKVRQLGWHDTFAVLLGFAGDNSELVTQVIAEALQVNPGLTARCLRLAEHPDPRLLTRFIEIQEALLYDANAGNFLHSRAAEALAEHGRGPVRAALWRVVIAKSAPISARVAAIERLAEMPTQVRFEPVADRIRQELVLHLPKIFDEPAPLSVQEAAVNAIVTARLKELGTYLGALVMEDEWSLRRKAWQACETLGLPLPPRQHTAFVIACQKRLAQAEEELFHETIYSRWDALNEERIETLRQLATSANLPLLLKRRFSFSINKEVGELIDRLVHEVHGGGELPPEAQDAWVVLTQAIEDTNEATAYWLELLRVTDELTALAAAHRLMQMPEKLPSGQLHSLLDPGLSPARLSAIAQIIAPKEDRNLIQPLEALIRSLIPTITGREAFEAFTNLVRSLQMLDGQMGKRVGAVAEMIFWHNREEVMYHHYFPWRKLANSFSLEAKDYQALLAAGGNDTYAAVLELCKRGAGFLGAATQNEPRIKLNAAARKQLQDLATSEHDPHWQYYIAIALAAIPVVESLPWLLDLADCSSMAEKEEIIDDAQFGEYPERYLSFIFRSIGYLARVLLEKKEVHRARAAITFLRERYAALREDEERSIVIGLTTGLGFLGDWEPILVHLGPGEPWMHEAAEAIFDNWIPTPLSPLSKKKQLEVAAHWIIHRLHNHPGLAPQVRSTLESIKAQLEIRLGRHIQTDEE